MEHSFIAAQRSGMIDSTRIRTEIKGLKPVKKPGSANQDVQRLKTLRQACADVESIFAQSLIKAMRNTIPDGGHLVKTPGADIYDSMAYDQLAVYLTRDSGLGLGQAMFEQMVIRENLESVVEEHPDLMGSRPTGNLDLSGLAKVRRTPGEEYSGGRVIRTGENDSEDRQSTSD